MSEQAPTTPAGSAPVLMYSTGWCPYCRAAKQFLDARGVAFEEIDLDAEPARREEMHARGGGRTVPQIFVRGTHVGGFTDMVALDRQGRFDPLLQDNDEGDGRDE